MILRFKSARRFALEGIRVVEYPAGLHDVPEEVSTVALAEGWAEVPRAPTTAPAAATAPAQGAPAAASADGEKPAGEAPPPPPATDADEKPAGRNGGSRNKGRGAK